MTAGQKQKLSLLIDDDLDDQEIFLLALEEIDKNIICETASNAVDALQKLRSDTAWVPDFVFIDINMPRMNGIACLKELRTLEHLSNSEVIMYSTTLDKKIIDQCIALGADKFIVKPPELSVLVARVAEVVKGN